MKRKTLAILMIGVLTVSAATLWKVKVAHSQATAKAQALHAEVLRQQSEVQKQKAFMEAQDVAIRAHKLAEEQARAKVQEEAKVQAQAKAKEAEKVIATKNSVQQASLQTIPQAYQQYVLDASKESGVAPELIVALGEQESGWDCNMLGSAGDTGCLQILPNTGAWAMREMGFSGSLWNPQTNIRVGAWVLATYIRMEGGNLRRGLAAYNAGPNGWDRAPVVARGYAERVLNRVVVTPPKN